LFFEVSVGEMFRPFPLDRVCWRMCAPLAAVVAGSMALTPAAAETKLTELSGQWLGSGTDRDLPFATAQPTQCYTRVTADPNHMTSDTECNGKAGLNKRVRLSITFASKKFTGTVEQTSTVRGSGGEPTRYAGRVTGTRTNDTMEFVVRFSGLMPNAHVVLKLTSPTSFTWRTSTLGATLTAVEFHRPAAR
jgi:hypothetical protein